ncbi:MAG: PqqD family protein [Spirochaeta sp.]
MVHFPKSVQIGSAGDAHVLRDTATGNQYELTAAETRMAELLLAGDSIDDCIRILVEEQGIPEETIRRDLLAFITKLRHHQLAEEAE